LVTIDGQVRLIRLQTDNFCLILHQQTDKWQNYVWTNAKWASVFCFPFEPATHTYIYRYICIYIHIYVYIFYIFYISIYIYMLQFQYTYIYGNSKLPFVFCKQKTEALFSLAGKRQMVINICCFSKHAHLCWSLYSLSAVCVKKYLAPVL
jgi:hypothetical protein